MNRLVLTLRYREKIKHAEHRASLQDIWNKMAPFINRPQHVHWQSVQPQIAGMLVTPLPQALMTDYDIG